MPDTLLFIPGFMCDARVFQAQIADLSRHRPVMVIAPVTGTTLEEMSQAVLAAAPASFGLAGFGLGAQVALDVLRRDAGRVTRLALISADPLGETPDMSDAREKRIILARTGRLDQAIAADYPANAVVAPEDRPALMDLVEDMALALGPEVYLTQCRALQRRRDQQKTLRMSKTPTLIIAGESDPLVPLRRQTFMAELMPAAQVQVVAGAGHFVPIEKPQALSQALGQFFADPLILR